VIDVLPETEERVLAVRVSGKLTAEDYDRIGPELSLRAERFDSFDIVAELTDLESVEPAAIVEDLRFFREHAGDIGRVAVITSDSLWQQCLAVIGEPVGKVVGTELRRFDDRAEAWNWLVGD
jgi:hypothetical protein